MVCSWAVAPILFTALFSYWPEPSQAARKIKRRREDPEDVVRGRADAAAVADFGAPSPAARLQESHKHHVELSNAASNRTWDDRWDGERPDSFAGGSQAPSSANSTRGIENESATQVQHAGFQPRVQGNHSIFVDIKRRVEALVARMKRSDLRPPCTEGFETTTGVGCMADCQCKWYMRCHPKYLVWPDGVDGGDQDAVKNVGVCGWDPEMSVFVLGGSFLTMTCVLLLYTSFSKAKGTTIQRKLKKNKPSSEAF